MRREMDDKPKPKQGADGRFLAGNGGNGGRPAGSRNKLSEAFLSALCEDFDKHGVDVIERVRTEDPAAYLRTVAGLMPKRIETQPAGLKEMTDDELYAIVRQDNPEAVALSEATLGQAKH